MIIRNVTNHMTIGVGTSPLVPELNKRALLSCRGPPSAEQPAQPPAGEERTGTHGSSPLTDSVRSFTSCSSFVLLSLTPSYDLPTYIWHYFDRKHETI